MSAERQRQAEATPRPRDTITGHASQILSQTPSRGMRFQAPAYRQQQVALFDSSAASGGSGAMRWWATVGSHPSAWHTSAGQRCLCRETSDCNARSERLRACLQAHWAATGAARERAHPKQTRWAVS